MEPRASAPNSAHGVQKGVWFTEVTFGQSLEDEQKFVR